MDKRRVRKFLPEYEIVLLSIRIDQVADHRLGELLEEELDWSKVLDFALQVELLPPLYHRLIQIPGLPSAAAAFLQPLYFTNALRNLSLGRSLVQVASLLSAHGIPCLAYKGPALTVQAYGDLSLRQFLDLDLLIHPQDFQETCRLLTDSGWTPHLPLSPKDQRWLLRTAIEFPFRKADAILEIHWSLSLPDFFHPLHISRFWQDTVMVEILDHPIPTLSPANAVFFTCLHAARHGWNSLKWAADLAYYRKSHPDLNWLALLEVSRQNGFHRILTLGLLLAEALCGPIFPPEVRHNLLQDEPARRIAAQVIDRHLSGMPLLDPTQRLLFYYRSRERFLDRLFMLLAQAFLPKEVDWRTVSLPGPLFPLYYLIHPLRMLGRIIQKLLPAIFHNPGNFG